MKLKSLIIEFVQSKELEEFLIQYRKDHPQATADEISDAVYEFISNAENISEGVGVSILQYIIPAIMSVYGSLPLAKDVEKKVSEKMSQSTTKDTPSNIQIVGWAKTYAKKYGIPESAILKILRKETSFSLSSKHYNPKQVGDKGNVLGPSYGACQIKVPVAQELYDDEPEADINSDDITSEKLLNDVEFNIRTATKLIAHYYHRKFKKIKNNKERMAHAAGAFNAGADSVRKYGPNNYGWYVAGIQKENKI